MSQAQAFVVELLDNNQYQSLMKKDGQLLTHGMHSGRVHLAPGSECGWHSTEEKEEILVFLKGSGTSVIKGQGEYPVGAGKVMYIPPKTDHNIQNTSDEPLEYVFCVAPVAGLGEEK